MMSCGIPDRGFRPSYNGDQTDWSFFWIPYSRIHGAQGSGLPRNPQRVAALDWADAVHHQAVAAVLESAEHHHVADELGRQFDVVAKTAVQRITADIVVHHLAGLEYGKGGAVVDAVGAAHGQRYHVALALRIQAIGDGDHARTGQRRLGRGRREIT